MKISMTPNSCAASPRRRVSSRHVLVMLGLLGLAGSGCTSLVNRTAFLPDRDYTISDSQLPANVRRVNVPTTDGEQLEGFLVPREAATKLVLYFHGNAGNIAHRLPQLQTLASVTGASVLGIGYRGYGASTGTPSERGIYRDAVAALHYAEQQLGFTTAQIFLCGVSLGSAVAVDLAQGRAVAGLILVTPMTSGRDLARDHGHGGIAWLAGGAFDSLAKVPRLRAPVLVVHGTNDEIIPYAQGRRLFEAIPTPKRFVTISGARHNNVAYVDANLFWDTIAHFLAAPPTA